MNATYRITFEDTYCRTLVTRFQRQRFFLMRPAVQIPLQPIALAIFMALVTRHEKDLLPLFEGMMVAVLVLTAVEWFYLRNFPLRRLMRRSGEAVIYALTEDGIEVIGSRAQGKMQWAVYPKGVRFTDGIMLLRPGAICWLPDNALSGATVEEVLELLRSKTTLRHVT